MPGCSHTKYVRGGDELTDLSETPSPTVNEGTQAPYGMSQHKTIVEEKKEKDSGLGLAPEEFFQSYALQTIRKHLLENGMKAAITTDICSQSKS